MKQEEAIKIVENCDSTREPHQQALSCLIKINRRFKEIHGKRLFNFFEMISILNSTDEALSYVVSNIDYFSQSIKGDKKE
jgi:hypothetical protein